MRVLLVQPEYNVPRGYAETPSVALLILGTLARDRGHTVRLAHLDVDREPFERLLRSFSPDVVGITVNTFQVRSARLVAQEVKRAYPNTRVVVGGPHAGAWDGLADDVVVGEGENRWLQLLGEREVVRDINDVPEPDYSLVDLDRFSGVSPVGARPSVAVMASRGCPFECAFCNTPVFWGRKVRFRSPELVVREIDHLWRRHGVREVFFQDDTFNANHAWALEIFGRIVEEGLDKMMRFKITSRVNEKLVTMEFLDAARRAGVWNVFYGVESGSQAMLDRMRKGIRVDEIRRAIRMTHEAGIETQCGFIVGMPGESRETLRETGDLIREVRPTRVCWGFATPFPFTDLDREVTAKGHKLALDYGEYEYNRLMVRTDSLDFDELAAFRGFRLEGS